MLIKKISIPVFAIMACTLVYCFIVSNMLTVTAASPAASSDIKSIQAGYFSLMLKNDGTVWAWGYNDHGQLGDGTLINNCRPVKVPIDDVKEIAAGDSFAMALKNDGTVWVWGSNLQGQYGNGMISSSPEPSIPGQVPNLNNVRGIAVSWGSCYAIKNDGTVWAWGSNVVGLLGDGTMTTRSTPAQVKGLTEIVAISSDGDHTLALDSSGKVWAWGYDDSGELGNSSADQISPHGFKYAPAPVLVPIDNIVAVAAGDTYSLALKNDGTVWAWGGNEMGELGDGTLTDKLAPIRVLGLDKIVEIDSGGHMSMALKNDGTLWFWGLVTNLVNEAISDGTTITNTFHTPGQYNMIDEVKDFSLSNGNVLALKNDGTLWAWGSNWFGQLGIGTFNNQDLRYYNVITPTKVLLDPDSPAVTVRESKPVATIIYMPDLTHDDATNPLPVSVGNSTAVNPNMNSTTPTSQGNNWYIALFGLIGLVAIAGVITWNRRDK